MWWNWKCEKRRGISENTCWSCVENVESYLKYIIPNSISVTKMKTENLMFRKVVILRELEKQMKERIGERLLKLIMLEDIKSIVSTFIEKKQVKMSSEFVKE